MSNESMSLPADLAAFGAGAEAGTALSVTARSAGCVR